MCITPFCITDVTMYEFSIKKISVEKKFGVKIFFGENKFSVENFWDKKILVKKNLVKIKFGQKKSK